MRVRPNLALFTFAAATVLSACERRTPESTMNRADDPHVLNPTAKGIDAPPEVPTAPQ